MKNAEWMDGWMGRGNWRVCLVLYLVADIMTMARTIYLWNGMERKGKERKHVQNSELSG